jgi:ribonuclease HI
VKPPRAGFAVLHVDGGSRGEHGPAAIGYVVEDRFGARLAAHAEAIGNASAAEAECRAMLAGLARAHALGLERLVARSDSKLLVGHLTGERRLRSRRMVALGTEIADLRMQIGTVIFEWVPANANGEAHRLVASALDALRE